MTRVWQCERVDYHTMVRPVNRCTLCGASVREEDLKSNNEPSKLSVLLDLGFDYVTAKEIINELR